MEVNGPDTRPTVTLNDDLLGNRGGATGSEVMTLTRAIQGALTGALNMAGARAGGGLRRYRRRRRPRGPTRQPTRAGSTARPLSPKFCQSRWICWHGHHEHLPAGSPQAIQDRDDAAQADDGDLLNLVVEMKGYRGEDAKEKKSTMDNYWVPVVNRLGSHGRWTFAEFTDVYAMQDEFGAVVEAAFGKLVEDAVKCTKLCNV